MSPPFEQAQVDAILLVAEVILLKSRYEYRPGTSWSGLQAILKTSWANMADVIRLREVS